MKSTKRLALCGIISALACAVMYITTVTDIFSLCGTVFAAFAVVFIYIEFGTKTALTVYAAVSVITLLILPDKFPAALFAVYAGYYPILKAVFERMKKPPLSWTLKLLSFNLVLVALIIASKYITAIETDTVAIELTVFALANAVFIMSDLLATRLITIYLFKYRSRLHRRGLL